MGNLRDILDDTFGALYRRLRAEIRRISSAVIPDRILREIHRNYKRVDHAIRDGIDVWFRLSPELALLFDGHLPDGLTLKEALKNHFIRGGKVFLQVWTGQYAAAVGTVVKAIGEEVRNEQAARRAKRLAREPRVDPGPTLAEYLEQIEQAHTAQLEAERQRAAGAVLDAEQAKQVAAVIAVGGVVAYLVTR